ncbi:MAG: tail fiber domain-containing protein [Chitinophagaceae bacterium]
MYYRKLMAGICRIPSFLFSSKYFLLMMICFAWNASDAQNVAINTDGSLPDRNAMLDIKSSNKGLLIPRMNTQARLRIPNTQGLLVYDINTNSFWYNTGRQWRNLSAAETLSASGSWLLTGNAGTVDGVNFLGTTDNVPLNIRVNNQQSGRIDHTLGNTFWGFRSGFSVTSGNDNTGIGASALFGVTTGYNNTAVGSNALQSNNTGYHNTAFGRFAMISNTGGYNNVANGTSSMFYNTTGYNNVANGVNSLYSNTTGFINTATGADVLYANTTGIGNTASGYQCLFLNQTGDGNTAAGIYTMFYNSSGSYNTATGNQSLYLNTTAFYNTATGSLAMRNNTTGDLNIAMGFVALASNISGRSNAALGGIAMANNVSGNNNTAGGVAALPSNITGDLNTALGSQAMIFSTAGSNNTAIGAATMYANVTGNNNTVLGAEADLSFGDQVNSTAIGSGAVANASNKVRIGNSAVTVIEGQVPFTTPSDGRFKFQVQDDVKGLDFILQLHPVTYQFDAKRFDEHLYPENKNQEIGFDISKDPSKRLLSVQTKFFSKEKAPNAELLSAYNEASLIRRSGFIAQEVEQAALKTGYNFSGLIKPKNEKEHYSLSYDAFVVPLVKAVQEQQRIIQQQQQLIEEQNKRFSALQKEVDEIKKLLQNKNGAVLSNINH